MRIIFLGTPEFSTGILALLNKYYEIALVVTKADALGKHNKLIPSPVKLKALELGLKVFTPKVLKEDYEPLLNAKADMLITAAYGQFIPSFLLNKFKYRLNVHASLLPKRRGGAPIQRALIEGDKVTGVSIMEMTKKMDAGRIYAQKELEIKDSDNSTTLFAKLSVLGRDLLIETLPSIIDGSNEGVIQDETEATFSYVLTKEDEILDFSKDAFSLVNQIRGLALEPGAYFKFKSQAYKILAAEVKKVNSNAEIGQIITLDKNSFVIKCKSDALSILVIKPAGKKALDIKSFLNGQRIFKENDVISN